MSNPREQLRTAVARLPAHTRVAMLRALSEERIIAGAYTDGRGGVCPLLGAHRRGPRHNAEGFAFAWDRFVGAWRKAKRATAGQVKELRALIEESFVLEEFAPAEASPRARRPALAPQPLVVPRAWSGTAPLLR